MNKRPFFQTVFTSPDEPRLRAGWRLLLQVLLILIISTALGLILNFLPIPFKGSSLFGQFMNLIVMTGSAYIARRWFDKRSFESLGLKLQPKMWIDLLAGIVITFVMMGLIYILMYVFGWITFEGFAWEFESASSVILGLIGMLVVFILVGWNEELLSRGYQLQNLADGINLFWGVVISSAVFGILHLGNPNATWVSAAGIFLAGIFLAYGYTTTKQLWLPMGLHLGWNFFEGVIFGFPVSGLDMFTLTRITVDGPELVTGGAFGPEAGLIILPALVVGFGLIYLYTRQTQSEETEA